MRLNVEPPLSAGARTRDLRRRASVAGIKLASGDACGRLYRSHGMALLEVAVWLIVLLPLATKGLFILALLHDQNVLQGIPQAALREVFTEGMRWVPDSKGSRFEVRFESLRMAIASLTQASIREGGASVFKTGAISSKACFWVYTVNQTTGTIETRIASECDVRGADAQKLSLEKDIAQESSRLSGIQNLESLEGARFMDRVVILGLVVRGELADPLTGSRHFIQASGLSFPRQEIVL